MLSLGHSLQERHCGPGARPEKGNKMVKGLEDRSGEEWLRADLILYSYLKGGWREVGVALSP